MKTIGIIGGMSWESTLEYYRIMNKAVKEELGGLHSAKILMYSYDFDEIETLQHQGEWDQMAVSLTKQARNLERAGADFVVIATNTMHKLAGVMQTELSIPILHIADATAQAIKKLEIDTVGLLGTKFTMEEDFYKGRLHGKHGVDVIVPNAEEREVIHKVIYEELCKGVILESSREEFKCIIDNLVRRGAKGIILGCTEIPLLVKQEQCSIPLFDTTTIHAQEAVKYAIGRPS